MNFLLTVFFCFLLAYVFKYGIFFKHDFVNILHEIMVFFKNLIAKSQILTLENSKYSGRPNRSKIWYYSVFGSAWFNSAVSGKTKLNIYRIKSKIKES